MCVCVRANVGVGEGLQGISDLTRVVCCPCSLVRVWQKRRAEKREMRKAFREEERVLSRAMAAANKRSEMRM